ncbi:malate synthase G [Halobacillus sp. BBL2006]|uniref:malate synthase G n=1 Tax=Halobacillus sp. BBL2006 TaxID=1543706 RepID=UPI000543D0D4|nr:malate synthase G [Halobacillus sp. BBL2006]KHE71630.1 malate synthase [Halobacillus sp. BBL2006]
MSDYVKVGNLEVDSKLYEFIVSEALPESGVNQDQFWEDFNTLIHDLTPINKELLAKRDEIQKQIDTWHNDHSGSYDKDSYKEFLKEINYLEPEGEDFTITTKDVDDEIAVQAGPQLVVPADNARYALNAANARYGSLYDALYGTDVIPEEEGFEKGNSYNQKRGEKVVAYAKEFLDEIFALEQASHKDVVTYVIEEGTLAAILQNGQKATLRDQAQFKGYQGSPSEPSAILLQNHGLHLEIEMNPNHPIGKSDPAGISDIVMESATTTIMDCEDSVAAVDAEDKVLVYRNLLGLMKGRLKATFQKAGRTVTRNLNPDRKYITPEGEDITLHGRSLMFMRNVGHLMTTPAILDEKGEEVPEGIMDGVLTSLVARHDLIRNSRYENSAKRSIYIVKPKMHGSEEVSFANDLFNRIEDLLSLTRNTIKMGIMDEERRTTLNLKNCIEQAKERIVFINTGFLDRTGDEIHTSMAAGPMIRKKEMKGSKWLDAYEKSNVSVGLDAGLFGRAQIGKGMWAMPEMMKAMLEEKGSQLKAGANTAWVPSPTAATLHAIHYHYHNVKVTQQQIAENIQEYRDDILEIPVADNTDWSEEEIQEELDNNAQGILGYVVRWVNHGVGCSKVPDIHNIGLMEDRATLRISSQHMANWLHQNIVAGEQVLETMKRMAKVVDQQNAGDPDYQPMAENYDESIAFQAACDLVFKGLSQPNGYTEPILHKRRLERKQQLLLNKV